MTRSAGKILTTIWHDPDFVALRRDEQRVYLLLLTQNDVNWCGICKLTPSTWAGMCSESTVRSLNRALKVLEHKRFIATDKNTQELLIRSFVKYNVDPERRPGHFEALARDFKTIYSPTLTSLFLEQLDENIVAALTQPTPRAREHAHTHVTPAPPHAHTPRTSLVFSLNSLQSSVATDDVSGADEPAPTPPPDQHDPNNEEEQTTLIQTVITQLANQRLQEAQAAARTNQRAPIHNHTAWLRTTQTEIAEEATDTIREALRYTGPNPTPTTLLNAYHNLPNLQANTDIRATRIYLDNEHNGTPITMHQAHQQALAETTTPTNPEEPASSRSQHPPGEPTKPPVASDPGISGEDATDSDWLSPICNKSAEDLAETPNRAQ